MNKMNIDLKKYYIRSLRFDTSYNFDENSYEKFSKCLKIEGKIKEDEGIEFTEDYNVRKNYYRLKIFISKRKFKVDLIFNLYVLTKKAEEKGKDIISIEDFYKCLTSFEEYNDQHLHVFFNFHFPLNEYKSTLGLPIIASSGEIRGIRYVRNINDVKYSITNDLTDDDKFLYQLLNFDYKMKICKDNFKNLIDFAVPLSLENVEGKK